jgi:pSer/pThr/pTyr-binding forkhead associated (FHA) protein
MFIILEVLLGSNSGKHFRITPGQRIRVGRSSLADITFPTDGFVSGTHFALENDAEKCWITDLNSRNGTFVNGQRVRRAVLNDGDTVQAGLTALAVRIKANDSDSGSSPDLAVPLGITH